jgi:microcystin-dependent protein
MPDPSTAPVPVGTIVAFVGPDPQAHIDTNWYPCDGRTLNKNAYVELFNLIMTTFGQTDGDQFPLPDLRGMFPRGVDPTGKVDPDGASRYRQGDSAKKPIGPVVGSFQDDQFMSHQHTLNAVMNTANSGPAFRNDGSYNYDTALPTGKAGGNETRPKNVYVYYLIYAGAPVPQTS